MLKTAATLVTLLASVLMGTACSDDERFEELEAKVAALEEQLHVVEVRSLKTHDTLWGVYTDLQMVWWTLGSDFAGEPILIHYGTPEQKALVEQTAECLTAGNEEVSEPFYERERFAILRTFALQNLLMSGHFRSFEEFEQLHQTLC